MVFLKYRPFQISNRVFIKQTWSSLPEKMSLLKREKRKSNLSKNPQGDWLKNIEIAMVLPNPTGKDSQKEMVILKNPEEKSGTLKGYSLYNGKTEKPIPETFFGPNQQKVFRGKQYSSAHQYFWNNKTHGF
jgi:hypothetical protein